MGKVGKKTQDTKHTLGARWIRRDGPAASALDAKVVPPTLELKVAAEAPVLPPRVTHHPVRRPALDAPPHNRNDVIDIVVPGTPLAGGER